MGVVALDADALVLLPPEGAAAAAVEVEGKGRSLACGRKLNGMSAAVRLQRAGFTSLAKKESKFA